MRRFVLGSILVAGAVALVGCAGAGAAPNPTVTIVAPPEPAPTVTVTAEVERRPDVWLSKLEAWTICASAALGELARLGYTAVMPYEEADVVDKDDGSFTAKVAMEVDTQQPVIVDCEVAGTMGDPRVTTTLKYVGY